jgi:hypothetical protein
MITPWEGPSGTKMLNPISAKPAFRIAKLRVYLRTQRVGSARMDETLGRAFASSH